MTTAEHLMQAVTTAAREAWTRWADMPDTHPEHDTTLTAAMYGHGVAHLLHALRKHAPEHADAIARDLWDTWENGGAVGDDLREWAQRRGGVAAAGTCVTCDLPEPRWNPFDPLYVGGGSQCPDCNRADLNDEATRNQAEVAS